MTKIESRGREFFAPRDNVIFGLGLFVGLIGIRRTFLLCPDDPTLKIPSDWNGITDLLYADPADPSHSAATHAVGACDAICDRFSLLRDTRLCACTSPKNVESYPQPSNEIPFGYRQTKHVEPFASVDVLPDRNWLVRSVKKLRAHLSKRPNGRDTEEALARLLADMSNALPAAREQLRELELKGYLNRVPGDRLELTPKADTLEE